jgi:hypothetical protein
VSDLRSILMATRERHGELTAAAVVADATAEDHPLHHRFEWNDGEAGRLYRLDQARHLIRSVKIEYRPASGERRDVRAFLVRQPEDARPTAYVPTEEIAADPFQRQLVLREMRRDWEQLRARYEHLAEFMDMIRGDLAA